MALSIVRYEHNNQTLWGVLKDADILQLDLPCTTTGALLELGYAAVEKAVGKAKDQTPVSKVNLLSPITAAKVLCQGANYRQHMIDSGMDPDAKDFNMFFTKSSASITAPTGQILRPKKVQLLDYEVEMTLVIGKKTDAEIEVSDSNLHEYVAGICIGNDVSARDIQIPQMQFHKGKSYRTFCPLGPVLCLLDKSQMHYLNEMQLTLSVNGKVRQSDNTQDLVFKPAEALSEYSQIHNFEPGDVLMTGTPAGCALSLPHPAVVKVSGLLPEAQKWALFVKSQKRNGRYLKDGDRVESSIKSRDGLIDLGQQSHVVASID